MKSVKRLCNNFFLNYNCSVWQYPSLLYIKHCHIPDSPLSLNLLFYGSIKFANFLSSLYFISYCHVLYLYSALYSYLSGFSLWLICDNDVLLISPFYLSVKHIWDWDFPGSLEVKTLCCQCSEYRRTFPGPELGSHMVCSVARR